MAKKGVNKAPSKGEQKVATIYQNSLAALDSVCIDASHQMAGLQSKGLSLDSKRLLKSSGSKLGKTFSKLGSSVKW